MIPLSVLDLSFVFDGSTPAESFRNTVQLARHVEALGYRRFWLAEHHNMPGVASAATSVLIGHVAGQTRTIRVGAGGIMLPNHSPLVIAEQFGTLETLYPGRIDLGLGRAPGSDVVATRALRRDPGAADRFPDDVLELQALFEPAEAGQVLQAVPGAGLRVPLWILGSSTFGANLAAELGLPYTFASHFAPAQIEEAVSIYRERFRPSEQLDKPYLMLGVNAIAAETDEEARRYFTSMQQTFTNLLRGTPGRVPPPIEDINAYWSPTEAAAAMRMLHFSAVGSRATVHAYLTSFIEEYRPDELMVTGQIFDADARLRSFEMVAEAFSA